MIGIYQDSFIDYLRKKLGDHIKVSSKNIVVPCPWCEYNQQKDHYHLYIGIDVPIFHCFHAGCPSGKGGTLAKLLSRLEGYDISERFVDKEKLNEAAKQRKIFKEQEDTQFKVYLPELNSKKFMLKDMYINQRLKFSRMPTTLIKGLIYDVEEFLTINRIPINETLFRLKDYLHTNFVGFLTENYSTVIFRNIDHSHSMKFFKLKIQPNNFLDYYRLSGGNYSSKKVVLAEGVFDIFTEYLFDSLNIKDTVKLYASALSSKYESLIYSIVFHEQIFKPDIVILSDKGISKDYYMKLKKYNKHIINSLVVFFNKSGKDFGDTPVTPSRLL